MATPPSFTNRLGAEKSPYLLQHAHNPVDWYPWGEEAFERARVEDKPIFLSVGYSACHWCHVMERESFENTATARILNDHFVSIKVDREERPDVDEVYMTALQMIASSGGWPMSMFLTPDGRPFYGGTYYPPETRQGRVGFGSLLTQLADAYATRRDEVEESADGIVGELRKISRQSPIKANSADDAGDLLDADMLLQSAVADMSERFDAENGGFGGAPKFPPHHALRLLTIVAGRGGDDDAHRMLTVTLDRMASGGIYDQIGGGFHRYATDAVWQTPHFEKMLYDNALLARVYAQASDLTGNAAYSRVARETCDWLLRDLLDSGGGFYAALDADSEGEEGKYYVWTRAEVEDAVGAEAGGALARAYHLQPNGNYRDEATGQPTGANIPYLSVGRTDAPLLAELSGTIADTRASLLALRYRRVPPGLDDKVITAWNGLAIGALAVCGDLMDEPRYLDAARRAADFALTVLQSSPGTLLRRYAKGEAGIDAYLDDYAFLADGLLDLYEATDETPYLDAARALGDTLLARFWDADDGGFFYTAEDHETLITRIARTKDLFDGALPSANGVAARVLARLGDLPGGETFAVRADAMLRAYRALLERAPQGVPTLIEAALLRTAEPEILSANHSEVPITLRASDSATVVVAPGEERTFRFTLEIAPGYHINSRQPKDAELYPTVARFSTNAPAAVGPIVYPASSEAALGDETLTIYAGTAEWFLPVRVADDAANGRYSVVLEIDCQPCSETECLAPRTLSASFFVEVAS